MMIQIAGEILLVLLGVIVLMMILAWIADPVDAPAVTAVAPPVAIKKQWRL
jgi:hypothetical protein